MGYKEENIASFLWHFSPKIHNFNVIISKPQIKPNSRIFCIIIGLSFKNVEGHETQVNTEKLFPIEGNSRNRRTICSVWFWIWSFCCKEHYWNNGQTWMEFESRWNQIIVLGYIGECLYFRNILRCSGNDSYQIDNLFSNGSGFKKKNCTIVATFLHFEIISKWKVKVL